jgi:hypothetical protein
VNLSARGSRNLNDYDEKIKDKDELAQVRRQARRVWLKSFLAAFVLTLLALTLPAL